MKKYIFVTGGVCSSLGKGIAAASIGLLLKRMGYKVVPMKIDPYLNVDPGTMSPERHGEVFVTDDGSEADLDLGHYERFLDQPVSKLSTMTMGQVYRNVLKLERTGSYLGRDIQIIPHITDEIKRHVYELASESKADVIIVEIGGTVGDIEGQPCIEAMRQIMHEVGRDNACCVMLTLLPYLQSSKELKTKPTQMAVRELTRSGINPDLILARSDYPIPQDQLEKISSFCNVPREAVIPAYTLDSIYAVPSALAASNIHQILQQRLGLPPKGKPSLKDFTQLRRIIDDAFVGKVRIGMVTKYNELDDAYLSVHEALKSACYAAGKHPDILHINSELLESGSPEEWDRLKSCDGILVPGGFGKRGIEGKIQAAEYARTNNVPYFGICLGSQILAIEFARNVCDMKGANSTEVSMHTSYPIVDIMDDQRTVKKKGGTMRKGSYPCHLKTGSRSAKLYGQKVIHERHRHRFEFNNLYRKELEKAGLTIAGTYKEQNIVEIVEVEKHPFMIGCQFHPEFTSRPTKAHPLFLGFVSASLKHGEKK
ncbi:CTP synthase [Candidatus Gracilibacteria bacterium CG17_big_fil_post_rev_8_21_14_2_50_48_13]|nr:MAG: CTP synthase [Candidatus Gracilibacteria bacterium CG17_big_fil_post_rev_8_21_14_2_50_48_13]